VLVSTFFRTSYVYVRDEHVDSTVSSLEVVSGVTKVRRIGWKTGRSSYSSREYPKVSQEDSKRCTMAYLEAESNIEQQRFSTFRIFIKNRRTHALNLLPSEPESLLYGSISYQMSSFEDHSLEEDYWQSLIVMADCETKRHTVCPWFPTWGPQEKQFEFLKG
ncbi:unnamed protein product, partial [Heterotrigona itama]